jgi:hypothetical protein
VVFPIVISTMGYELESRRLLLTFIIMGKELIPLEKIAEIRSFLAKCYVEPF